MYKRRRENNIKFIVNFIWLWREKKILIVFFYLEGNFIKNVVKEIISFCKVFWCFSSKYTFFILNSV